MMRLAKELIQQGELDFTFGRMHELAGNGFTYQQREKEWRVTLLNFLDRLTCGPIGQVFNAETHIPPEVLLEGQSILSLERFVDPVQKADFIESFLYSLYENVLKPRRPIGSADELRLVIVIEEIHHLADSVLNVFFREMRKWGCGLVFTAQHPSLVPREVRGNCHTTIAQNLESPEDLEVMGETLLLDRRKLPYLGDEFSYLSRVKAGSGLYLTKLQSRYTKPFVQHIYPMKPVSKEIGEEELVRKMEGYFKSIGLNLPVEPVDGVISGYFRNEEKVEELAERLSGRAKGLLFDVLQHPRAMVTERYDRLDLKNGDGHRLKRELLDQGLLEESHISNGKGQIVILVLTELGRRVLGHLGVPIGPNGSNGNGGPDHEWVKEELAHFLHYEMGWEKVQTEYALVSEEARREWTSDILWDGEWPRGTPKVDIHAERAGKRIAFEVESGKSYYLKNILTAVEFGYDYVISVALNRKARDVIRQKLKRLEEARVKLAGKVFVVHQGKVQDFVRYLDAVL